MTVVQSIILGIVQGLTEFLPISSSAHLVLVPRVLGWDNLLHQNPSQISFDVMLHLGSLIALLLYFRKDIISLTTKRNEKNNKLLTLLAIGSIPIALGGIFFGGFFEKIFSSAVYTAALLVLTGVTILFAEAVARLKRDEQTLNKRDSILIGLAQAVAIAPGISRSGVTISAGLMLGLNREAAARFSFLLAIPAVFGAFIFSLKDVSLQLVNVIFITGLLSSFVFSYAAIKFLLGYLQKGSLKVFAAYCIVVGLIIIWVV
ncbi:hypothetical protein LCGC14_2674940 [marine sediment metagenome]|uniref:Undecaprenyl-diphosphatase n=1 Tax=marine sediment metagenome TaxID=412755 RepID=A0A0F9AAI9_9ZZZZ